MNITKAVYIILITAISYLSVCVVYFETYGCQMNVNDTEIAWSILKDAGYTRTTIMTEVCMCIYMSTFIHV